MPSYTPPLGYIESTASSGVSEALVELSTFLLPFSEDCTDGDEFLRAPLRFHTKHGPPATRSDLLHGFYMAIHK
jgi:hypothetical protein